MSRYYRSITRYEALRIVADAAHLPLLIFFALFFAAGVYVGRWSVVLETRQRRKHLAEAVRGIVDGVLAGTSKTEGAVEDDGEATREIIEGVLEGLRAGGAARAGAPGGRRRRLRMDDPFVAAPRTPRAEPRARARDGGSGPSEPRIRSTTC